ncbi:gamma-butyrobetaine dioxygenase-like isoform X2 [Pecten maximus]|nr:gamma-butyrobetaine dioxygenase-like isoform X2 [Pecten maximus]
MEIHLEDVKITDDGHLSVRFKEEDHTGTFPPGFLQEHSYSNGHLALKKQATKINPEHVGVVPEVQWSDVRDSEESLYQCLKNINEHGLCMVRNGSIDGKLVEKFALKIGPIWDNTYGAVWDVKSQKTPTNFGYTNKEMQYHMDLPFYQAMPGIEFLHCLRFDATVEGGQTLFLDITDIAENFRKDHPEEFNILATIPFTFARVHNDRDYPINMVIRRPIIQLNREHEVVAVFWNPTVTGALQAEENEVESFYKAYQLFAKQLYSCQDKEMVVRLQPGEIVIWNNRRLVHRRNAFHGDGDRHFRGVYIDICEYKSRLSILSQKYGDGSSIKRVGNGDWF